MADCLALAHLSSTEAGVKEMVGWAVAGVYVADRRGRLWERGWQARQGPLDRCHHAQEPHVCQGIQQHGDADRYMAEREGTRPERGATTAVQQGERGKTHQALSSNGLETHTQMRAHTRAHTFNFATPSSTVFLEPQSYTCYVQARLGASTPHYYPTTCKRTPHATATRQGQWHARWEMPCCHAWHQSGCPRRTVLAVRALWRVTLCGAKSYALVGRGHGCSFWGWWHTMRL